jgi:AraC-type DNA-binding domain-containing proteins
MIDHLALQKFYAATKIPLQLFDNNILIRNYGPGDFHPNPVLSIINCLQSSTDSVCYTSSPDLLFFGLIRIQNSSEYLIIGPAMAFKCTRNQAENILKILKQPKKRAEELLRWFSSIPLCDNARFHGILCFLNYILNGITEDYTKYIPYQTNSLPINSIDLSPTFIEHFNEELDIQLLSSVEYGDLKSIEAIFNVFSSEPIGIPPVAPDALRSLKNIFIYTCGVVSRAALKGGLDYDTVNSITSNYLDQIEALTNHHEVSNLLKQLFLDFTRRTASYRSYLSNSFLVNKIYREIQTHLYEKITTTIIAKNLNMNSSYICRHFKQETGKTITEFTNEIKIEESIRLLETTQIPLIQISTQLGFSSQNYFHTIFKKVTGKTPIDYRTKQQ